MFVGARASHVCLVFAGARASLAPSLGRCHERAPAQGLGLVTAPWLAELTRKAYLAMTPLR